MSLSAADALPATSSSNAAIAAITTTDIPTFNWNQEITVHVHLEQPGLVDAVTINYAAVGQNGPAVFSLTRDVDNSTHWFIEGALLERPADVESASGGWYFLVATPEFPDGALRGQLETRNSWFPNNDGEFHIVNVSPWDGATVAALPPTIVVEFDHELDDSSISSNNVTLQASGGDASFTDGNEQTIAAAGAEVSGSSLTISLAGVPWQDDAYQLTLDGDGPAPITDVDGRALGRDFISTFSVDALRPPPATLMDVQERIFTPSCAQAGCHSGSMPAGGLNLSSAFSYQSIVDVPSAEEPTLDLIEPYAPHASFLLAKSFGRFCCFPHPEGAPPLGNSARQLLWEWVSSGASAN